MLPALRRRLPMLFLLAGALAIAFSYSRKAPRPVVATYQYGARTQRVVELQVKYLQVPDKGELLEAHRALFRYAEGRAPSAEVHRFRLPPGRYQIELRLQLAGAEPLALRRHAEVPAAFMSDKQTELQLDLGSSDGAHRR